MIAQTVAPEPRPDHPAPSPVRNGSALGGDETGATGPATTKGEPTMPDTCPHLTVNDHGDNLASCLDCGATISTADIDVDAAPAVIW